MQNGDAYATLHDPGHQLLAFRVRASRPAAEPADADARAALEEFQAWSAAGRPGAIPHAEARRLLLGEPG
ncbi:MAG TPA: hypothetical protein VK586_24250 [Streptosporangiaceae bacterium]|nr:hypothetical protein [Streptosporangiaceae bacterium]